MKLNSLFLIIIATLLVPTSIYSQFAGLKNKVKDATKKLESEKSNSSTDLPTTSQPKLQKDANGFVIDDPEVKKILDGKTVYYSSTVGLLRFNEDYKLAGVAVSKTKDSLHLVIVAQRKYGGVSSEGNHYAKIGNYYFDGAANRYAVIQDDQSIILFNHNDYSPLNSDVISANKSAVENVSEVELNKKVAPILQEIKKGKVAQREKESIKSNETFYKSGGVVAVKSNPQLETEFLKVLNQLNGLATVAEEARVVYKKALLIFTDWTIEANDLGIPIKMTYATWTIGNYTKDKACFFQKVYMKKDHLGGGKYGEIKYDESQKPSVISCELIKK